MNIIVDEHYPIDVSALPHNWIVTTIGTIIGDIRSGFSAPTYNTESRGVPHLRPGNISRSGHLDLSELKHVEVDNVLRVKAGDIVFNNTNSPELVGKCAEVTGDQEWGFSNHLTRLRFGPELLPSFVSLQLHFLWACGYFRHHCTHHVNQASISAATLAEFPFVLAPTDEQHRIVDELQRRFVDLDASSKALESVAIDAIRLRASLLHAAYTGKLVAPASDDGAQSAEERLREILERRRTDWETEQRIRQENRRRQSDGDSWKQAYPDPVAPDVGEMPPLPDRWVWASAEQLSSASKPITYGVIKLGEAVADGVPVLRSSDVRSLHIELDTVKRVAHDITSQYTRTTLEEGDVVLTIRGTLGGVAVVPAECEGFNISREVARLAPVDMSISSIAAYFIAAGPSQEWLGRRSRGIAYVGINIEDVRRLPIPLPPVSDQALIVEALNRRLNEAAASARQVAASQEQIPDLRRSLLHKAFSGQMLPLDESQLAGNLLVLLTKQAEASRAEARKQSAKRARMSRERPGIGSTTSRRSIRTILGESKSPIRVNELFRLAGYAPELIDEFYSELRVLRSDGLVQETDAEGEAVLTLRMRK